MSQKFSTLSPLDVDTERILIAKILSVLNNSSGGGSGGGGSTIVTVNPSSAATQGSLQFNKTNHTLWINQDGTAGGWVQLI